MSTPISGSTSPTPVSTSLDIIYFPFYNPEEMGTGDSHDDLIEG